MECGVRILLSFGGAVARGRVGPGILLNSCHRSPIYKPDGLWIPTPLRGGVSGKGGGVLKLLSPPLAALTPSPTMGGELITFESP